MERLFAKHFTGHANLYALFPAQQSAYRTFHSTETAVLKDHNNPVRAVDDCHVSQFVPLDLNAAFDTVDHQNQLCVLSICFGIGGTSSTGSNPISASRLIIRLCQCCHRPPSLHLQCAT